MKKLSTSLLSTFTKNRLRWSARLGLTALAALAMAAAVSASSAKNAGKSAAVKSILSPSAASALNGQTATPVISGPARISRFPAPAATQTILYDQTDQPAANSTVSQNFEAANDTFDNQLADDFVVPAGGWTIGQVNVLGVYFNGPGPATSVNVTFYADAAGLPGAAVPGGTYANAAITSGATSGAFQIVLPASLTLTPGHYWVSVQANLNFTPGGEWGWTDRIATSNSPAAWENPLGGFGTPCTPSWGVRGSPTGCNIDPGNNDQIFQLLTPGGIVCSPNCNGVLVNNGFETGNFTPGWIIDGTNNAPVVQNAVAHSGTFAALAGNVTGTEPLGDSSFYQQFVVPASGGTLSFWHNDFTVDSIMFDWQDAYITDSSGTILQTIFHQCLSGGTWIRQTVDMGPYAGMTVRVKFLVHQDGFGDDTAMYVDDVGMCPAAPVPTSAVSRKVHGGAGTFDINLPVVPISGAVGIEDRQQGTGVAGSVTLWYNGDFNNINGLANEMDPTVSQSAVYDNFVVTAASGWDITAVFSDNLTNFTAVTGATWEIRSGVSSGNGGTLVASGSTATPTVTPTGRSGFGFTEFQVKVAISPSLHLPQLPAGQFYWLNVTPIGTDAGGRSFVSDTSGANAVGVPPGNDLNAFINSTFFAANFANTGDSPFLQPSDFSMGVIGLGAGGGLGFSHQMVVTFANPVTVDSVSVTQGIGNVDTFSVAGNVVTINLSAVTDQQRLGVTLHNVCDGSTNGNVLIPMGVLTGDATANQSVNGADVALVKSQSGATSITVTGTNFREDVNANGSINAGDVALVKSKSGDILPP